MEGCARQVSEEEITKMNLLDFQKLSKKGEPYDILDGKIADYITQHMLKIFVLNGVPYIYNHGYYMRDLSLIHI